MEETFDITFEGSNERFKISIKKKDLHKVATLIYELCIENKIDATVYREDINEVNRSN